MYSSFSTPEQIICAHISHTKHCIFPLMSSKNDPLHMQTASFLARIASSDGNSNSDIVKKD